MISYDDFAKLDLRVAKIISAEKVENADKLLKLTVDVGDIDEKTNLPTVRQVISGISEFYSPEELVNKQIIVLTNLEPKTFRGQVSQGMLLAADGEKPVLLIPAEEISPGTKIC